MTLDDQRYRVPAAGEGRRKSQTHALDAAPRQVVHEERN
jgi:hypothetical protein